MATGSLAPLVRWQGLDSTGVALSGCTLSFFQAGTTTPIAVFADQALTTSLGTTVTADSAGRFAAIYLSPGASYKCIFKDAGGSTIWTQDGIGAVPASSANTDITGVAGEALTAGQVVYLSDGSGSQTAGSWFKADADFAYASTTPIIGMAVAAIASGASGTIRIGGTVTGLSALTPGSSYYVSATAGALTATAPGNKRLVGVSDTTTSLVLGASTVVTVDSDQNILAAEVFS